MLFPSTAATRFMAVLTEGFGGRTTYVKGAPERVLRMCGGLNYAHWHDRAELLALGACGCWHWPSGPRQMTGSILPRRRAG